MKCELVEDKLSAYIDNELALDERLRIEEHCLHCDACQAIVSQFLDMGVLMRQSEQRVDTEAMWERVAASIDSDRAIPSSSKASKKSWIFAMLATAASIAILWFAARYNNDSEHNNHPVHDHASLAIDFQEVIRTARSDPRAAITKLVANYQGQMLDEQAATAYLGYQPALFRSVPKGFSRVSTHVLDMPCCKCSATICERSDGTSLIVFEHKDEQPVWFGNSPSIDTQCSGKTCKIVESAGQLAVSWQNEDRQLTLIGANDIAEVNQWVTSMNL